MGSMKYGGSKSDRLYNQNIPTLLLTKITIHVLSSWSKVELALGTRALNKQPAKPVSIPAERQVTEAIAWTVMRVSEWIRDLGYPQYVVRRHTVCLPCQQQLIRFHGLFRSYGCCHQFWICHWKSSVLSRPSDLSTKVGYYILMVLNNFYFGLIGQDTQFGWNSKFSILPHFAC